MNTKELQRGTGAGQQFWFWPFGSLDDDTRPRRRVDLLAAERVPFRRRSSRRSCPASPARPPTGTSCSAASRSSACATPTWSPARSSASTSRSRRAPRCTTTGPRRRSWARQRPPRHLGRHPAGRLRRPGRVPRQARRRSRPPRRGRRRRPSRRSSVGEPLRIRVTDRDMNLNEKVKDKVSVTVRNARGEQEVAILEETGRDTGVFEGSVRTALALGERVAGRRQRLRGRVPDRHVRRPGPRQRRDETRRSSAGSWRGRA